jgi:hypothetical protein
MNPNDIVNYANRTVDYLNNDKVSFEYVIDNSKLDGKLGFAMISTAMAAFDAFAWILYQSFDLSKKNKTLFNELINDIRFFDKTKYYNEHLFYGIIRCGVIHQLYPKNASIFAKRIGPILNSHNGHIYINSYALYCDVLEGCKKIRDYFSNLTDDEKMDFSLKLLLRAKIDGEESSKSNLDISTLPVLRI